MSDGINKALLAAQQKSVGLKKDGTNAFAKFSYVSIEEVVSTARDLLHKQGLVFYPAEQEMCAAGGESKDIWIKQRYELLHVPSGETKDITRTMIIPDNNKMSLCQAQGSAESYLLKNTLRELLLMPRFDAKEDIDSHDNAGRTAGNPGKYRR